MKTGVFYNAIKNKIVLIKKLDVEYKYGTLYSFQDSKHNVEIMTKWNAGKNKDKIKYIGRFL